MVFLFSYGSRIIAFRYALESLTEQIRRKGVKTQRFSFESEARWMLVFAVISPLIAFFIAIAIPMLMR